MTEPWLARVLDLLWQNFDYIIADIPMPLPPSMVRVLTLARHVVTVLTPDAASVRDTGNIRQLVAAVTGANRVISVLNRFNLKGGLEQALIEKALGGKADVTIADLGPKMLEAINLGMPAVKRVSALRRHLAPLVRDIAGVTPNRRHGSWAARMFGR